jgi:hypothetical protein
MNPTTLATIAKNEIAVEYRERASDGTKWLIINVPNGWDDVKKISRKVLVYNGLRFTFASWNSDNLVCNFKHNANIAKIVA